MTAADSSRTRALALIAAATFLTLAPLTLLVPGLQELVRDAHGGTRSDAHAFMAINMATGILAVPLAMKMLRRFPDPRPWIVGGLLLDAVSFLGMAHAGSLGALMTWRAIDGMAHLPAVTMLMLAANRIGGARRGGPLGVVAAALMFGVGVGAPVGGILIDRGGPALVYQVGAALLGIAALLGALLPRSVATSNVPSRGYAWVRERAAGGMPVLFGFLDRFTIGVFTSTFTLFLAELHQVGATERGRIMALFLAPFAILSWPAGRLADRIGWRWPLVIGNLAFGALFASYGLVSMSLLPLVMVASGVASALVFSPALVLVSECARRGAGEGIFGAFQVAGSIGFLLGPVAGGVLVRFLSSGDGVRWETIFALVGATLAAVGLLSYRVLTPLEARWAREDA
ncbi:MAG: MFS transporter [Gemmatimonadaceae bacterium]|nr:MFS transporter [Gemmatimonadaceae bacterium]